MANRAIILAAGRGSRMGSETAIKPKCLTTLAGKTLLNWQLDSINNVDINDVLVVRGYRAEMIKGDFKVVDNPRWSETNMVASLFCAESSEKNTIISYSDIVYKSTHIEKLMKAEYDITITADKYWEELWSARFDNPLDDAETFKSINNELVEIGGKANHINEIEAQYMGLLKLTPKGWNTIHEIYQSFPPQKRDKIDMTSMLNELLVRKIKIYVVFVEGGWCEADTYSDILAYEEKLNKPNEWKHEWRNEFV